MQDFLFRNLGCSDSLGEGDWFQYSCQIFLLVTFCLLDKTAFVTICFFASRKLLIDTFLKLVFFIVLVIVAKAFIATFDC